MANRTYFLRCFTLLGPVFIDPAGFEGILAHMPLTHTVQSGLFEETSSILRGDLDVTIHYFGLAAFPSLHVAVFVLYSLWAREVSRGWLIWNLGMALVIFVGSMVTGYHYMVDGFAGALVGAFAWVVGRSQLRSDINEKLRRR